MPTRLTPEEKQRREQEKAAAKELTKVKKDCLERICKKGVLNSHTWIREMAIINKLWALYPDLEFWRGFSLDFQLNSAAWLLTENGKDKLAQEYRRQTTDLSALTRREPQELELATGPVEKVEIKKKVLTLRDFLK